MKNGWQIKKLCEICEIKPSKKEAYNQLNENDLVSFVPMEDLGILTKSFAVKKEKRLKEVFGSYTYFANGDLLLAKITPCFENGKIGIARNLANGIGFGSSEYIVFRPNGCIDSEYLYYFLARSEFREEGKKVMAGAVGHKRVPKEFIENYRIPIPPLTEQKYIVAILDKAFKHIDAVKANVEENLKNAREVSGSYLNSIFIRKNENWITCRLEDYIKFIDYRGRTPQKTLCGLRLITAKNVKNGFLQKTPEEFVSPKIYDTWMTRGIPNKGDVLFTTEAPLANVAQLDTSEKVVFAQRIIILQPETDKINQSFLKYLLLSKSINQRILDKGTGATVQGIKAKLLKKIEIFLPESLQRQEKIVAKLDNVLEKTKSLQLIYQQKLTLLEELKKSLLQKAFSGELTKEPELELV